MNLRWSGSREAMKQHWEARSKERRRPKKAAKAGKRRRRRKPGMAPRDAAIEIAVARRIAAML